jgi:hypothetical protein
MIVQTIANCRADLCVGPFGAHEADTVVGPTGLTGYSEWIPARSALVGGTVPAPPGDSPYDNRAAFERSG